MAEQTHIVNRLHDLLTTDILRPNRFFVKFNRSNSPDLKLLHHSIKSVTLPSVTVTPIEIRRMGRGFKLPGSIAFSDTTITLYDDAESRLRNYFIEWVQEFIGEHDDFTFNNPANLISKMITENDIIGNDMEIIQMDRKFTEIAKYTLRYCFPSSIGELELSHDTNDTLSTFTVAISYAYFDYEKLI